MVIRIFLVILLTVIVQGFVDFIEVIEIVLDRLVYVLVKEPAE